MRVFGRYTLDAILGRGGMGVVWRARDESLGEDIALKFLPDAVRWDPGAFDDLKAETRRARQLTHPNIVRIHDFVEDVSAAAISMELVVGRTLTEVRLERENKILEVANIVPWLPQLGAALDYAHTQARVVHRDLKPSNIMLTREGVVKVTDFGVARSLADSITRVSMMSAGTLVYMSPQQAMGEEPSAGDDIYSVGATLYELLTGKPPFHTGDVRVQLFQRKPDSIAARRRALGAGSGNEIPAAWEETIAACMAKDAAERPTSAGEIARRLCAPVRPRIKRWRRLTRRESLFAAVAITLLGWSALSSTRFFAGSGAEASAPAAGFRSDETRAVLAWNFDGDALDAAGHGLAAQGIWSTLPTRDRHGRIDRAAHFNGNAVVESPDSPWLSWAGDEPFSVSVWVRPDALRALGNHLVGNVPGKVGECQWHLSLLESGQPRLHIGQMQEEGAVYTDGSAAVRPGVWAHVAAVSDGMSIRVFLNGTPVGATNFTPRAIGRRPAATRLRVGNANAYAQWAYAGDLDELRIWRRALSPVEITTLAKAEAPPRFIPTRGHYPEQEDLPAVVKREFGPDATLADWEDIRRWHADDVLAFCDELELTVGENGCLVQRGGERIWQSPRHYFIGRWSGTKPAYYLAHEELGGFTLALASWYGFQMRALVQLPHAAPRGVELVAGPAGAVEHTFVASERQQAVALSWRATLSRSNQPVRAELRLRDGRKFVAMVAPASGDKLALLLGDEKDPVVSRQFAAGWGDYRMAVVVRDGLIRFRAVNAVGGAPLFQETVRLPALRMAEIAELVLTGAPGAQLIVE